MSPKLYGLEASSAVRSVLLAAAALEVKLEFVEVNLLAKEHLSPEFTQLNPQHTVPTLLDDDGTCIWDSHAINAYLTSKYGRNDNLYPKDLVKRAIIDQRLHFDSGLAFPLVRSIGEPIIFSSVKTIPEHLKAKAIELYYFLENFLGNNSWMAGQNVTIADFSLITSVTTLNFLVPIESNKFPKLQAWIKRSEGLPYYDKNQKGLDEYMKILKARLS